MADVSISSSGAAANLKQWTKVVRDDPKQTKAGAVDIGWVRRNDSRLSVIAKLDSDDKTQYFKLKVITAGKMSFAYQADKALRIQVYDPNGQLVADSKDGTGKLKDNFEALRSSDYTVKQGTYTVSVSRDAAVPAKTGVNYGLQFRMGDTYTNDYITRIAPAQKTNPGAGLVSNPVNNMLWNSLQNPLKFDPQTNAAIFSMIGG